MRPVLLALCASSFFLAQPAYAEPNGKAIGYWENGPGSRVTSPVTPEPSAMLVFGAGLLVVGIASRRKSE